MRKILYVIKFAAAAKAISGTIQRTMPIVASLADASGNRYVIKSETWSSQLPMPRKIDIIDITQFQATYVNLTLARTNYNIVVLHCLEYLKAVDAFLTPDDKKITRHSLAAVLATERLFVQITANYSKLLLDNLTEVNNLQKKTQTRRAGL